MWCLIFQLIFFSVNDRNLAESAIKSSAIYQQAYNAAIYPYDIEVGTGAPRCGITCTIRFQDKPKYIEIKNKLKTLRSQYYFEVERMTVHICHNHEGKQCEEYQVELLQ
jgi:hypothetical protein